MYICTRTYAHKRPSPKTRLPKPHLREKTEGETIVLGDIKEEDVVWQDDPEYNEKMAKLYPGNMFGKNSDTKVPSTPFYRYNIK